MYNRNPNFDPKTFIKTTIIIHLALFMGQALFMALSIFMVNNAAMRTSPGNDPFFFVSPLLVIGGIFLGTFLFRKMLGNVAEKPTLKEKLMAYQTAFITRCALSEAPSMFGIVCFLLTGNYFYLCVTAVNVLYFIMIRPTKFKILDDLNLGLEEQGEMESNAL